MTVSTTRRRNVTEQVPASPARGRRRDRSRLIFGILGAVAIVVVWQVLSLVISSAILASPVDTAIALAHLVWGSRLWWPLLVTLKRLVIGLAVGVTTGLVLGALSGLEPRLRAFLEPIRWVGMTVPAVIIASLAMLWFGLGDVAVTFVVAVIVIPVVFVNTVAGVLAVDERLLEMSRVYHFSWRLRMTQVYLPAIASPVLAGLTLAAGMAVRAVVLAEVLGAMDGIGYSFSRATSYLETPEIFAWVVVLLALVGGLELGILRPVRRRSMRWRKEPGS